MNFKDYQEKAHKTTIYPKIHYETDETPIGPGASQIEVKDAFFAYASMGLPSEVGEVLGILKKVIRDDIDTTTKEFKEDIKKELGDCLWYIAELASVFDLDLGEIATKNIEKLADREQRGQIKGSGDDR